MRQPYKIARTIFSISPVGNVNYTVIRNFAGQPNDGAYPRAALTEPNGTVFKLQL